MEIKNIPIEQLKFAEYNPRQITDTQFQRLRESIRKYGIVEPVVVNMFKGREFTIVGGHMRVRAAQAEGIKDMPCYEVNLDETNEKLLNLALNKISGEWNKDMLAEMIYGLVDADADIKISGFEDDEVSVLLDSVSGDDKEEDIISPPKEPISKKGEVYELGQHRLMCGDATNTEDVAKLMNGQKADMVFTDPPYNIAYEGGMNTHGQNKRDMIQNDDMSPEEFSDFMDKALKNMLEKCDGVFYIFMSSKELAALKNAFERNGGHWQSFIIWAKNTFTLSRSDWQNQYEPILYGWNGKTINHYFVGWRDEGNVWKDVNSLKPEYDGKVTKIKVGDYHLELEGLVKGKVAIKKNKTDLWQENKPNRSAEHPTMKPINLIAKALRASSTRGQIILDLFGGSGSTLIASEKLGRRCYMMELDPGYCDVIRERYKTLLSPTPKEAKNQGKTEAEAGGVGSA